jgi:sulfonate transport system permease protein
MKTRLFFIGFFLVVAVVSSFYTSVDLQSLAVHVTMSLRRIVLGYSISVILSLLTAVFLGLSKYLRMAFKPVLSFFISIPTITWVPLLLVVTGISEETIVISIILGSYFAITFNTIDGFDNVQKSLIHAGRVLGYGRIKILTRIVIPAAFNHTLIGLKLGIAYSWRALVGAEMLGAAHAGLGYLVFASRKFYDLNMMILSLCLIGALGFLLNRVLIEAVEKNTTVRWGLK